MGKKQTRVRLRLNKSVSERLLAAAKRELRPPNQVMNLLLNWALMQRDLLRFDTAMLLKVNLSVSDVLDGDISEPWNHVVSGEWDKSADGTLHRLVVK